MKANTWQGKNHVTIEEMPDPSIVDPRDAIVRVTLSAICGSDMHLYNGFIPGMEKGDILGHEFMGEIVEIGPEVRNRKVGDRVVVAFPIACGECYFCQKQLFSLCERSNTPTSKELATKLWGHSPAGIYGYSHILGGYAGGQAEYVRVPYADVDTILVPDELSDEQVLFLSDIFPTGWMAALNCDIQKGETVAVWGAGPVGQFAIRSAFMLGAGRVIAIDRYPERLQMARDGGAETINFEQTDNVKDALNDMTSGRGPDSVIDAVGLEAHEHGISAPIDRAKQFVKLETGRPQVLRDAISVVRNGGTVSIAGVYGGFIDTFPIGAVVNRSLTIRSGQTHVQRFWGELLGRIQKGEIDPSFVITHRLALDETPTGYDLFKHKEDNCIKVVLKPGAGTVTRGEA